MHVEYSERFLTSFEKTPETVRKAFYKQIAFLHTNIRHPSLHAKKYDTTKGVWQARVNRSWRFYFSITEDTYQLHDITPHPK